MVLRRRVLEEAHDLSGEAFTSYMDQLYDKISLQMESTDVSENLLALRDIDELINVKLGESASKVLKFSNHIRYIFEEKHDPEVLILASKVLGHLARAGGAMTADEVEHHVKNALEWLRGERIEHRRLAAVLILKEMAENAPAVFYVHVPEFVDAVWFALRDASLAVRERAVEALRACLCVMEKRETRWRVQWYYKMFEATQDGLGKNASVHSIHGSLFAVGELLRNTGEFMMSRYKQVADIVFKYREHKDRLVQRSITSLLPRIAHFRSDCFVTSYLKICMDHILAVLRIPAEHASGFVALGEMAEALDGELIHYLPTITSLIHDAIAPRRGKPSMEALACIGSLAKAMGPAMETHVRSLLDTMFSSGLSLTLVESLDQIASSLPLLLPTIQDRLLDCISVVLSKTSYRAVKSTGAVVRTSTVLSPQQVLDVNDPTLIQLALRTLANFNFKGHGLLEFARDAVVIYLEDEDGSTRRDAAICCCKLVENSFPSISMLSQFTANRVGNPGGARRRILVEEVIEKLLIAAVADADVRVRKSAFASLNANGGFDEFLAQADSLRTIFIALNDEAFDVRELAISMAGRLSEKNPAYVLPALRRHLVQLLTDLQQSADSKRCEESAKLLGCLIRACERLLLPYIAPVHKALIEKLRESPGVSANNGVVTGVLATVGELVRVGGCAMRPYLGELMPLILKALVDGAVAVKREVAVATLGQVVQSTGYVVSPYVDYPSLLGLLLRLLNGELAWSTRREVLKVLGIMGAWDPHTHKGNQQSLQGSHGDGTRAMVDGCQHMQSMEDLPMDLWQSFATSEDYFSTVAINSLMRILRDPSLSSYHQKVVGSLMFIFKSMGLASVPYLPKVLPDLFHIVHTCEGGLKDFITWKLGTLVSIVRQHIRKYLPELLALISEFWSSFSLTGTCHPSAILHLMEQLCLALNDEFQAYLREILPCCIQVLTDAERCGSYSYVPAILHTLEIFSSTLDEHMHLLLPALIQIFRPDNLNVPVEIRRAAMKTLTKLIPRVQVSGHISALIQPLNLVLDGKIDELRKEAVDCICVLAQALGDDFTIFVPSIRKQLQRHRLQHKDFDEIEARLHKRDPIFLENNSAYKVTRPVPGDVISDPLNDMQNDHNDESAEIQRQARNYKVNDGRLRTAWEASHRITKEDWAEWMRHFSIELLKGSPSPALRTCARLAQLQPSVCRELFAAGFVSCWVQLTEAHQQELVESLQMAFSSPNIPPEILATLLNLAEFMEHDEKPLPIDIRLLGALAEKCQAFAKALHYKEMEFEGAQTKKMEANPVGVVEGLIHINSQLHQHEAAVGILTYAQLHLAVQLEESWYEKLQRWDEALSAYTTKALQATSPHLVLEATLGQMRCLAALARWEELSNLCKEFWTPAEPDARLEMAPMAARAAWNMGEWDQMAEYVSRLDDGDERKPRMLGNTGGSGDGSSNGAFFRAVLFVRCGKYGEAREYVERARKCLATELAALVLESYDRAYSTMVRIQQLAELEEVIDYCTLPVGNAATEGHKALIRKMWIDRIQGAKKNVEVWQALLVVHALVLPPTEDTDTWLEFASLCRRSGRISRARSTLVKLLQYDPELNPERSMLSGPPQVRLAYLKYLWSLGEDGRRKEAFHRLQELTVELAGYTQSSGTTYVYPLTTVWSISSSNANVPLLAQTYLKLGKWRWTLYPGLDEDSMHDILVAFKNATECARHWSKAWHKWALFNTAVMSHFTLRGVPAVASQYVVAAVTGYFRSIAYAANTKGGDDSLQDILRLLTLWFNHGATTEVQEALDDGFNYVNIDTWLVVLPQIIARIHSNMPAVRTRIQSLLVRIGRGHPQALMYPLLVACKSTSTLRREATAAQEVIDKVRQHSGVLVDQAELVSKELIRVAILWHEMWHEALEEASRLYFGEHNIEGMLTVLEPPHAMLEQGPHTLKEISFVQEYGRELLEAHECCLKYQKTGKEAELTQAWDLYYHVFKRINKQLGSLSTLELQYVSPELLSARNLELAVPGTYRAGFPVVTIAGFAPQLVVITSKQRPRRLTIHGSDGNDYAFLLKGHEDLRQDERVMQLFGLVNTLLANARQTAEKDLSIERYDVIPLSPNSGLIGWVSDCDTLYYLIREYREARKIFVNLEHHLMLAFAPDYEHLPLIAKIEVFEHALQNTGGNDLAKVLWLKSRTSEVWLDHRTNYTHSLAVMSMVGYLLGLGDRHPSNLMLHRLSGKIIHIDFGDCFEASMNREKCPEKVPFRLTRMLVKAMGVSGIEGNFISTCKNVMQVLRSNKDSVMAMMEAFVHDPLINWRLFNINEVPLMSNLAGAHAQPVVNGDESMALPPHVHQRGAHERELLEAVNHLGDAKEFLNERAVVVMARMSNKLTGRDFPSGTAVSVPLNSTLYSVDQSGLSIGDMHEVEPGLTVKFQVQKLIAQAKSHENLCQSYVGWCPFW